ncbi:hypothetical protein CRYUN_Cryun03dG0080700 [Craigia yunnanensis]
MFSASDNSFSAQQTTILPSLMHNAQQSSNLSTQQSSQAISKSAEETSFEVGVQPLSSETKSSGRKELPEDLFTASYVSAPAAVPGAYMGDQSHIAVPSSRLQGIGGFGSDEFILSSLSTANRPTGGHSESNPPNSFPTMGANPFG